MPRWARVAMGVAIGIISGTVTDNWVDGGLVMISLAFIVAVLNYYGS